MTTPLTLEYDELIDQVHDCIRAHVPRGAVVLMASKGDDALTRIDGYRAWHFPRDERGVYAGHHPATSVEAIGHLRLLYGKGAQYLVFPWTSRWWLDHYRELAAHLASSHELTVTQEDVCVIFELRDSAEFDAFVVTEAAVLDTRTSELPDEEEDAATDTTASLSLATPMPRRSLRVLTLMARHGVSRYPHAEVEIARIFERQMPHAERTTLIVDNALPRDTVETREDGVLLGGDNSAREFSAFDRALAFVGADIWSYDLVHFATSAFHQLYVAYLERFDMRVLQAVAGRAVSVGHIDCYNDPIEIRAFHSQHWLRTCFFMMPPAEVRALGSFVSARPDEPWFSGDPAAPFRADAAISQRYRDYIIEWLTRGEIGQGVEWHSRFALTPATLPAFEEKARTILNEHLLAIRLRAMGCRMVDVTWLSAQLRQTVPSAIRWDTSWRVQLAHRDRDAIRVRDARLESVGIAV